MSTTSIASTGSVPLPEITTQIQATLRSTYLQSQFPKATWLLDEWNLPVEDYYFKLKLCFQNCWRRVNASPTYVPVQDIFDPVEDIVRPRRIWIEGPSGYGKTSLVLKVARDWAKGEKYVAKNFDLVFVLRKQWLRGKRLDEVLHEVYNGHSDLAQTTSAIDLARERALLIIDDYSDEDECSNSDVLALLSCEVRPEMTVIVTSRADCSPGENLTTAFEPFIQKRVSLDGVSSEHLNAFLQANFYDLPESTIEEVSTQIHTFANKWFGTSVCKCPLLLLLVAAASMEDRFDVSQTRTEMYVTLLNFVIRRSMRKEQEYPENSSYFSMPFNEENGNKSSALVRLGKLAVGAIIKERYSFDKRTIVTCCGREALQLGLFVKNSILPGDFFDDPAVYECLHSSILEFMAAHYMCYLYVNGKMKKFRNLIKSLWLCCRTNTLVIPSVAGLLPSLVPEIFSTLKPCLCKRHEDFQRITTVLQECDISKSLMDVVAPLLPETWTINDSNFSKTSVHNSLLDHGLISERVKCVAWDVSCPVRLQLLCEIPKLDLYGPMSHLDPRCLTGVHCGELCFELKYEDPALKGPRNGWENVVSTTKHVQANKVSFIIDDHVDTMLSLLCNQVTSGQLQYINIEWIDCSLVMSKQCMVPLSTLISKNKVVGLHLTLLKPINAVLTRRMSASQLNILQNTIRKDSYVKKEMRSFIKCVGKSDKLKDFVLISDVKYIRYVNMKQLYDKGRKVWRTLKLRTLLDSDIPKTSVAM